MIFIINLINQIMKIKVSQYVAILKQGKEDNKINDVINYY